MALVPFVVACVVTAVIAGTTLRASRSAAVGLSFLGLVVAAAFAFLLPTGPSTIGGLTVEVDGYLRLVTAVGCVVAILLTGVAAAVRPGAGPRTGVAPLGVAPIVAPDVERRAMPVAAVPLAACLSLGPTAIALGLPPQTAALPAALVSLASLLGLVVLARDETNLAAGRQLFRAVAVAAALVIVGAAAALGDATEIVGQQVALGTAAVMLAAAVGVRTGAIPFHATVARVVPRAGLLTPFVLVWAALPLVVVAAGVLAAGIAPAGAGLGLERGAIIAVAALTLLVAPVVAAVTDDLDHVVAYSIVQDMGMVILAFAAPGGVWEPLRTWLLVVAASKSALVGWSVATRERFGSTRLSDLHGWALHSPVLAGALAFIAVATVGVPTFAVAAVRRDIADAVFDEPLASVAFLAGLIAIVPYLRLAAVGLSAPSALVRRAPRERLRRPQAWIERSRAAAAMRAGRIRSASVRAEGPATGLGLADSPGPGRRDPAAERAAARVADIARKFAIGAHRGGSGPDVLEGGASTDDARTSPDPPPRPVRREPRGPRGARLAALRGELREAWALNVVPIAAGLVFVLALLSFAVSAGAFGVRAAGEEAAPAPVVSPSAAPSGSPSTSPDATASGA